MGISLRPYQQKGVEGIRDVYRNGRRSALFVLPTGGGKCLAKGTPVMMFDGSVKAVEDVVVGEQLMGPDSKPRNVMSLARGQEMMYRVIQCRQGRDSYVVNASHILSLRNKAGDIKNISVEDAIYGNDNLFTRIGQSFALSDAYHGYKGWAVPGIMRGDLSVESTDLIIEPVGIDAYYGFTIDGDHLFLLGDTAVTHNTVTFCYIAQGAQAKGKRVLILVHRKELLLQASLSMAKMGIRHGLIAQINHVKEAMRLHMAEMRTCAIDQSSSVMVASIDTLKSRMGTVQKPDLIICDEAHHLVSGNKWGRIIEAFPESRVLGVTATPIRADGKGLGSHADGVFDEIVYGPSMSELIELGFLLPSTVFVPPTLLDTTGMKKARDGDFNQKELSERTNKPAITGDAIDHYKRICPGVPAIAFCVDIRHAEAVAEEARQRGIRAQSIDGTMHDAKRRGLIQALADGRIDWLTSADLISEGTDIPVVGCAIMLRKTQSLGLFLQQAGRILRPFPGQTKAYILDHVGNVGQYVGGQFTANHGLPEQEHEWTLDSVDRRGSSKKKKQEENGPKTLQCMECYAVSNVKEIRDPQNPACPECGAPFVFKSRTPETVDGELKEIDAEAARAESKRKKIEVARAQTYEELVAIGRERHYKNPEAWARIRIQAREKKPGNQHDSAAVSTTQEIVF